jgi:hypothetical protein
MCELEDSITSLGFVMQVLMQQGGVVKAAQLDEQGELVVELKSIGAQNTEGSDNQPNGKLIDVRKVFRENEAVVFSDVELQLVLVSVASFADSLFKSVAEYARTVQEQA